MPRLFEQYDEPSTADKFGRAFAGAGQSIGQAIPEMLMGRHQQKQQQLQKQQKVQQLSKLSGIPSEDLMGLDEKSLEEILKSSNKRKELEYEYGLKGNLKNNELAKRQNFISNILKRDGSSQDGSFSGLPSTQDISSSSQGSSPINPDGSFNILKVSDQDILEIAAVDNELATQLRSTRDAALKAQENEKKTKRSDFESERTYHTSFSRKAEEEADQLRSMIPKKESALNFARDSVESGNMEYFSPDKLADVTGIDAFRTTNGAKLITASKENLLTNMSRISAKGQNLWFEKRLNQMFPKIGQSNEANLTVQEMLEGELQVEKSYLNEFDRISKQDQEDYGFVKKDASMRARNNVKSSEKEIMKRTTYRMKELQEVEEGLDKMKKMVGKNVIKGTPFTLAMAKLYKNKFGDKALDVAEKNGYYIPTVEEFTIFQQRPEEFREASL